MTNRTAVSILFVVGFITFFFSLFNGFVWDDQLQIVQNEQVHSIGDIPQYFFGSQNQIRFNHYYRPLLFSAWIMTYAVNQANPFVFHFLQLILHIINGILVYYFFIYLLKNKKLSFYLTLFFLIHPINTESVSYISGIGDILFFFFGMSALLAVLYKKISGKIITAVSLLLLCALFTKESGILFFATTILFTLFYKRKYLLQISLALAGSASIYAFIRFVIAKQYFMNLSYLPIMRATFGERLLTMPQILFYYIKTFFYPKTLTIFQTWIVKTPTLGEFYLPLIIDILFAAGMIGFLYYLYKNKMQQTKPYAFFLLWFIVGMLLYIQIVPLDMTVADRWFYFPLVGLLGMLGIIGQYIVYKKNLGNIAVYIIVLLLIVLGARSLIRTLDWHDPITLYSHDIHTTKNNFELDEFLGSALIDSGNYSAGTVYLRSSIAIFPYNLNLGNLAVVYDRLGNTKKAKYYYDLAVNARSLYQNIGNDPTPFIYENAGSFYLRTQPPGSCEKFALEAVKKFPNQAKLWLILGISRYQLGEKEQALKISKHAYDLQPNDTALYYYEQMQQNMPITIR